MLNEILYPDGRIIVFCKAPEPGKVKTRLAKTIGDQAATTVHEYLAWQCFGKLADACIAPVELWCSPSIEHGFFRRCEAEFGFTLKTQTGECLGERMKNAFSDMPSQCRYSVIIGTDCPAIDSSYLQSAFSDLENHDAVLGPAEDGGYVLLGLRKLQPAIFTRMPWGTSRVLAETRARLKGNVKENPMLWDVDRAEDLIRLRDASSELRLDEGFSKYLDTLLARTL